MSDASEFGIENGVLWSYTGRGTDVTIPDGVNSIGNNAFLGCEKLKNITIPDSVTSIESYAFKFCSSQNITIPESVKWIGKNAFCWSELEDIILTGKKTSVTKDHFKDCRGPKSVFAPDIPFSELKEAGLGMFAARAFITRHRHYSEHASVPEYVGYISSQHKKLLPEIFDADSAEILEMLAKAKKINGKNLEDDYLQPAERFKAKRCIAYLKSLAESLGGGKKTEQTQTAKNELWDGIHFSLDGKQLIKYEDEPGRKEYRVPDGTKIICAGAFVGPGWVKDSHAAPEGTSLERIYLPESVTTVRKEAFMPKRDGTLFVELPDSLKSIPKAAFICGDHMINIALTSIWSVANILCEDRRAFCIYKGGPIDDLTPRAKPFAVNGFLFALRTGVEDMSPWRDGYLDHIRRNEATYVKQAAKDEFLLHLMIDEKILSEKGSKTLLDEFEKQGRADLIAALLNYRSGRLGITEDGLSLSDDDPEMKRMLRMDQRREQIKNLKGISGLTFVATGDLNDFGYVDEYTGAHDLSDLKAFIEIRGGFLRSAISSKTDYLICNDPNSETVKSRKARELGVTVITEKEFKKMAEEA